MLIVSLVASVVALALGCLGLLGFCVWLLRQQRRQAEEQARRDAAHDRCIKDLVEQLDVYAEGSARMGDRLEELARLVAPLPDKLVQLEQRDPNNFSFSQAAKLVGMGASVDDLTQSCGLSQSEAELMSKLHKARKP
ncbi:methyl-accepting chemotaxis protein [Stutzerimonas stutzeri TS44]|nr:methyl-accepting chemotaxis protein [Stutzerimonas stutzeri TS44]